MAETTELMKRPTDYDDVTIKRALELFMPKVIRYLDNDFSERERPHIEKQIGEVLGGYSDDGYHMARELERKGWEEDRELVDLMDEGVHFLSKAHNEIIEQWIKCYNITPERKIGDPVTTNIYGRKSQVGTIVKIYTDRAQYGVRYPDQGNTGHYLVDYEDVKDAVAV